MIFARADDNARNSAVNELVADDFRFADRIESVFSADFHDLFPRHPVQGKDAQGVFIPGAARLKSFLLKASQDIRFTIAVDDHLFGKSTSIQLRRFDQAGVVFYTAAEHDKGIGGLRRVFLYEKSAQPGQYRRGT